MARKCNKSDLQSLPECARDFIRLVIRKMRYRKKVRADVQDELSAHFEDELRDCATDKEKEQKAQQIIEQFGDAKLLGILLRRAKKRCRPLWRTLVVRTLQVTGIIALYLLICCSRLVIGTPNISVNYIEWLNNLVSARRAESQNARPCYEKAIDIYVEMPDWLSKSKARCPADFNDVVEVNGLAKWLNDNEQALELLREAVELPYYWNDYQSPFNKSETSFLHATISNIMKPLTGYRKLAYLLRWQVRYHTYLGNVDIALNDCIVLHKLGSHMQGKGLLIEQLVGVAIEALAHDEVLRILQRVDVPPGSLEIVQQKLEREFDKEKPVINLEAEKAFWYDLVQRGFTDDGKGSGRPLLRGIPFAVKNWQQSIWGLISFNYPNRRDVIAGINSYFELASELFSKTPLQLHEENIDIEKWGEAFLTSRMMIISAPANWRVSQLSWRLQTSRRALLTIIAVKQFEQQKQTLPQDLAQLVKVGYLEQLPIDPWSNKPLIYKRTTDGFMLYGVGSNFKDDGGQVARDDKGKVKHYADEGDWVFWPVQK